MDEEEVKFAGKAPRTLYDLLYFVAEHLREDGKAISNVVVDGSAGSFEDKLNCRLGDIKEVKIFSEKDIYLEFRLSLSRYLTKAQHTLTDLKTFLLVNDYNKVLDYSKILGDTIDCILQNLDAMKAAKSEVSGDICNKFHSIYSNILKKWVNCVENKDVGSMLDILNDELLLLLRETDIELVY